MDLTKETPLGCIHPVREGRTASELEQIKQASAEAWS
jgi:hypothetical protein